MSDRWYGMRRVGAARLWWLMCWGWVAWVVWAIPADAHALCSFFVSRAPGRHTNRAAKVALLRDGTTTVQTMQVTHKGPRKHFAMVVPVPVALRREQVQAVPAGVFERLERISAPTLVTYREQDPCVWQARPAGRTFGQVSSMGGGRGTSGRVRRPRSAVTVHRRFHVDAYDVAILSAKDSLGLARWLRTNKYRMPKGAAKVLRPYIQRGMYFFVAKLGARHRASRTAGTVTLPALRFHYSSTRFALPVRLGASTARAPNRS